MEDLLLTAKEVAALLRVSDQTIYRWSDEGKLASIVLPGRVRRYRREDVEALLRPADVA